MNMDEKQTSTKQYGMNMDEEKNSTKQKYQKHRIEKSLIFFAMVENIRLNSVIYIFLCIFLCLTIVPHPKTPDIRLGSVEVILH